MVENVTQNFEENQFPKWIKIGCLIVVIVVVLACISLCMLVSLPITIKPDIAEVSSYQSDYGKTARIFANVMRTNNIEFAKELVSEDNYSRLDEWAENREGFCYPFFWIFTHYDILDHGMQFENYGDLVDEYSANYSTYERYSKDYDFVYDISIRDIELRLIDDKWVITDFDEIKERWGDEKYRKRCRCINIPKFYK